MCSVVAAATCTVHLLAYSYAELTQLNDITEAVGELLHAIGLGTVCDLSEVDVEA